MTLQVAEQMAPRSCRSGTEKRVALRKARPLATLNPSKPDGPLSKGTLSYGGYFFSKRDPSLDSNWGTICTPRQLEARTASLGTLKRASYRFPSTNRTKVPITWLI